MKTKFEILKPSGEIVTFEGRNMVESACEYPEALSIKAIDKIDLKKRIVALNKDLASVSYLAPEAIQPFFSRSLELNGFQVPSGIREIGSSHNGSINCDLGGVFMHVSWFKMRSGKFEIVTYSN